MTPDEYCQQKAAASGSSFYYSFLFLPAERRRGITALYAFCREVDDVVDETSDAQLAATKLAWWRQEIANLFAGNPRHPVTQALQPHLQPFSLSQQNFNEIISGMEMDLTQTRYLDWKGLERYCYHVAGVVGLLAARIFGYGDVIAVASPSSSPTSSATSARTRARTASTCRSRTCRSSTCPRRKFSACGSPRRSRG
jgi:phytoene synthase